MATISRREERFYERAAIQTDSPAVTKRMHDETSIMDLKGRSLLAFTPDIAVVTNVKYLKLDDNAIRELPREIRLLRNLMKLSVSRNQLTELPPEIGECKNLVWLSVNHNLLTELPPEIGKLRNLLNLSLACNTIRELPPEIGRLTNLQYLSLHDNKLSRLPPSFGDLKSLKQLYLNRNCLQYLPGEFRKLEALEQLHIAINPFRYPEGSERYSIANCTPSLMDLCCNRVIDLKMDLSRLPHDIREYIHANGKRCANSSCSKVFCCNAQALSPVPMTIDPSSSVYATIPSSVTSMSLPSHSKSQKEISLPVSTPLTDAILTVQWHGYLLPMLVVFCSIKCLTEHSTKQTDTFYDYCRTS